MPDNYKKTRYGGFFIGHVFFNLNALLNCYTAIYAVASEHHYYQKEEKNRQKIRFNYNEFWTELGGEPSQIEGWFKMPVLYPRKILSDIPAKKRSQYSQRYQLMDQIKADVLGFGLSVKVA